MEGGLPGSVRHLRRSGPDAVNGSLCPRAPLLLRVLLLGSALALHGCTRSGQESSSPAQSASADTVNSAARRNISEDSGRSILVTDGFGRVLELKASPQRVLSLVPSATATLVALGARDRLVGRTEFDTLGVLAGLASVGKGLQPSMEVVVSMDPDLVILFAGQSDRVTASRLDDLGIPYLRVKPDGMADVRAMIAELGEIVDNPSGAASLVAGMDRSLARIRRAVEGLPRVRVAYVLGGNPPWVAGPESFISELLVLAGGENVFSDLHALYGPVSPEEFLVRKPDLVLAPEGAEVFLPSSESPIERVPASVEIPGPGLAESARRLAEILHPGAIR